jgi:hypothetical protein
MLTHSTVNKADPRVDSDLDGSRNAGAAQYGAGAQNTGAGYGNSGNGLTGSTGTGFGSSTTGSNTAGPHSSNFANKIDPRVDSDMDGSRNAGAAQYGTGAHNTGAGYGNTGNGLTGSTGTGAGYDSNTSGPHSSNLANKVDPRVDSDRDGSRNLGASSGTGYDNSSYGNTGSGLTGSTHTGAGHTGGSGLTDHHLDGPAPNTAGPHKSDMLNKVDPRIDSDRDGSKTVGGNPQY